MKRRLITILFSVLTLSSSIYAQGQSRNADSLYKVLKTEKEDTLKVLDLAEEGSRLADIHESRQADSLYRLSVALANKLHYTRGICATYVCKASLFQAQNNFDSSLAEYAIALNIAQKNHYGELQRQVYVGMGIVYAIVSESEQALTSFKKALQVCEEIKDRYGMGQIYQDMANVYMGMGNYSDALINYLQGLAIFKEFNNKRGLVDAYGSIGLTYDLEADYPNALKYQLMALKAAEELDIKQNIASAYNNLAQVEDHLHNYAEAIKDDSLAIILAQSVNDKLQMSGIYGGLGTIYQDEGNNTKALEYLDKSAQIARETDFLPDISASLGNIGMVYIAEGKYDEALKVTRESRDIAIKIGDKNAIANSFISLAKISIGKKDYKQGKNYYDSAIAMANELHAKDILRDTYQDKAVFDSLTGNFTQAFRDFKYYVTYRDSLSNEINTRKIVSEQMSYDFEKQQAQTRAEQERKDAIATTDRKRQTIITVSISVGLLLVLAFSVMLFSRFRLIQKQKGVIEEQKLEVETKNKEILDSITYAKRLQDAILPPLAIIKKNLPESFVLYKPKDIVAGDFYWMERAGESILIAAADCTGHGVPGAMVSVVCSNALNRAVKEFKITDPAKILDKTRALVLETFEKSEGNIQDGMDISLASITYTEVGTKLSWAGAYNSLWIVNSSNEIKEIPGDKQPIGKMDSPKPFTTHAVTVNKGDNLYLFSDGYADQFGGDRGKKFKYKQLQEKLLAIASWPMEKQQQELETVLKTWMGDHEQVDDILVIGIRV
jgi:tetratricopeptide (TPR) repeat protein